MYGEEELFSKYHFHDFQGSQKQSLIREIDAYPMADILNTPQDQLELYFFERFKMDAPQIEATDAYLPDDPKETSARERQRDPLWDDDYIEVSKTYFSFTVCVPFKGDGKLFDIVPTSYQSGNGRATSTNVVENEIQIVYRIEAQSSEELQRYSDADISRLVTNTKNLAADAKRYNDELPPLIARKIAERKASAAKSKSIITSINIPVKKRSDVPSTYSIPSIQKKPLIIKPKPATGKPDPTLDSGEYESILTIMKDMALAMERSPHTFATLKEEDIRNFFLVLLNGHYQGAATGETFNGNGKTDILIRYESQNAFIAECKIWRGSKQMNDAIDQLLGYVTWRDTKTAIVVFNKKKNLSDVINKAKEVLTQHPQFKSSYELTAQTLKGIGTIFGYKFTHKSDPNKEIFLTLMVFQVDTPE